MKKIKLFVLTLVMSFVLIACSNQNKTITQSNDETAAETMQASINLEDIDQAEFKYIDNGGFYVNNKGVAVPKSDIEGFKIVEWYFDPLCPYCLSFEAETSPYLNEIMGDNTLIKYMPLSFLGRPENEDPNNRIVSYSDVITSIILSMVENDPENVTNFMHSVLRDEFVTKLSEFDSVEDRSAEIKKVYTEQIGGKNWDNIEKGIGNSMMTVFMLTRYTGQNDDLKSKTPNGSISVPLLYVQGDSKILPVNDEGVDVRKILEEALK